MKTRASEQLLIPYIDKCLWGEYAPKFREKEVTIGQVIHEVRLGPKCKDLNKTAISTSGIEYCHIEKYDCGYV